MLRALRNLGLYFLVWMGVGLFLFSQDMARKLVSGEPTPWWHYLTSWMVGISLWTLITPAILWLGRRFAIERNHWVRRALLHMALSVVVALVQLSLESMILFRLGMFPALMTGFAPTFFFLALIGFHQGILTYFTILGIQAGFRYYNGFRERQQQALRLELHASELETQLARARLSALKMQLQPHFLFNTLNAIMVLVRQQKGRQAEEMLARLGDLLRCVLEDVEAQEVSLRRELEYLKLYLSIEQVRFADRLRVDIAADPAVLCAAVPQMGLQPIVENAIRHGLAKHEAAGRIAIRAARANGRVELTVSDDGPGFGALLPAELPGIGLSNTRARLRQLYGDAAELTLRNGEHGGAVVTISLPYRELESPAEREVAETHALHDADR
ncbi:MAG TPA: histidine kinase [Patescibacteria group bacterium]|nr:histidine kinase [Patescibacteria group bacterium]